MGIGVDNMPMQLYGQTEFARMIGWKPSKFTAYWGKKNLRIPIPEPYAYVGNRPAWTMEQIEDFKKRLEAKSNDEAP